MTGDDVVKVPHALKSATVEYVARYEHPGQIRVWETPYSREDARKAKVIE